ncbi:MAG: DUF4140 domain-containing protein, partial [Bacteroidetes bacterium]|nr:DUF4140 domain-containing protein [Bacteroidota bacterium]
MKRLFVLLLVQAGWLSAALAGDDKNIVPSVLQSAIVYRSGAELVHLAKAGLKQGNNELVIENISNSLDVNSVQIKCDDKITIMSIAFSTDYLAPAVKPASIRRLEDSAAILNKEMARLQVLINTDKEMLDLLKANKEIGGTQTGLSVAELAKMMDYYKGKVLELQNELTQYGDKNEKLKEAVEKINLQIEEEERKNTKTGGRLVLQLLSPLAGNYNFTVSYITRNAFWNPTYDIRVESIDKPVRL